MCDYLYIVIAMDFADFRDSLIGFVVSLVELVGGAVSR